MSEKTNYRVTLERRGRDLYGRVRWFRKHVDVEATSIAEAKNRAQLEHHGWRAVWAEQRKPRRAG